MKPLPLPLTWLYVLEKHTSQLTPDTWQALEKLTKQKEADAELELLAAMLEGVACAFVRVLLSHTAHPSPLLSFRCTRQRPSV